MNIEAQARQYFNTGYNCAESVLLAVCRESGYTESEIVKFIPRMATGFLLRFHYGGQVGGGIARNGGICGALSGAIMAIGLAPSYVMHNLALHLDKASAGLSPTARCTAQGRPGAR